MVVTGDARLSACGTWRYALGRAWGAGPRVAWVMLNPSTADADRDDPTITRCLRRAQAMGAGEMRVVNLFGLRATDPRALRHAPDPVGPENDAALSEAIGWTAGGPVICAWGRHGAFRGRGAQVTAILRAQGAGLFHLNLTADGAPRHPLYVGYDRTPRPWPPAS